MKNYFTFKSFVERNPRYQKFEDNNVAKGIYEDIMRTGENIYKMQVFTELDLPALTAVISEIENQFSKQSEFDLKGNYNKSCLGVMVKDLLKPFGYEKVKSKNIPQGFSKFVSKASVYKKNKDGIECKLVKNFTFVDMDTSEEFVI